MKKTGFTLIELLGVVVILGIIGAITVPIITGIINDNKAKAKEDQTIAIARAAKNYLNANAFAADCTPASGSQTCTITKSTANEAFTVGFLKSKGYLEEMEIKDYADSTKFSVQKTNGKFKIVFPA